ncbi:FIG000906: Predicted Permease [plant metagenome]|uniref:FIG000906: Predicted Permease n=1 Tax=plant metagenome TaxID=1297885 RepID=A0A484Q2L4_9ZZZZ|nr:LPS export ABC transporter permease LptG [Orrella dioscoreae]
MRTARRYLAREIYRSCTVVLLALLGLFTFFALVDELDGLGGNFTLLSLLYLQALALPTRLYDLLPIGLLIGAILALAGLAQRNELVILRVSGVSGLRLMGMLWLVTLPVMVLALLLSEVATPAAELRSGEANLLLRGKAGGGRMASGYWFKEPVAGGGSRILNVKNLLANGGVGDVTLYEFENAQTLRAFSTAKTGRFEDGKLILEDIGENTIASDATDRFKDAAAPQKPLLASRRLESRTLDTTLTPERLLARVLTPERMSLFSLWDYIDYLHANNLQTDRQVVAVWRKLVYPFTLLVMMTIAAPISFMQTRRGGVGAKVFIGILLGVGFFMLNQLALNVGMLGRWPPWVTALVPNAAALTLALGSLWVMESRHTLANLSQHRWPWRKSSV